MQIIPLSQVKWLSHQDWLLSFCFFWFIKWNCLFKSSTQPNPNPNAPFKVCYWCSKAFAELNRKWMLCSVTYHASNMCIMHLTVLSKCDVHSSTVYAVPRSGHALLDFKVLLCEAGCTVLQKRRTLFMANCQFSHV